MTPRLRFWNRAHQNLSDFLSRHSSLEENDKQGTLAEEYVNFLASAAVPKAMTLAEIQEATAQDITMQCLAYLIPTQSWRNIDKLPQFQDADRTELNRFKQVRHELTVNGPTNIILRDRRIIIPAALRDKAISIAQGSPRFGEDKTTVT